MGRGIRAKAASLCAASQSWRRRNAAMSNMPAGRSESVDAGGVVHRLVAPNPGPKTLQGTNSYVVGQQQVYIIDPGPNDERHLASIADWLDATGGTALGIPV